MQDTDRMSLEAAENRLNYKQKIEQRTRELKRTLRLRASLKCAGRRHLNLKN